MHDDHRTQAALCASLRRQIADTTLTTLHMAHALVEAAAVITQLADGLDEHTQAEAARYASRYRNIARQHRPT